VQASEPFAWFGDRLATGLAEVTADLAALDGSGWWVERDNPAEGADSWSAGPVAEPDVLATVLVRLWPPRRVRRRPGARPPTAGPR